MRALLADALRWLRFVLLWDSRARASSSSLPLRLRLGRPGRWRVVATVQLFCVRFAFFAFFAFFSFFSFFACRSAFASPFDPRGSDWEGLSELVALAEGELGPARVVVPSALDFRDLKREDGVFLVHPERALDVDELSSFMRAGGRVILLDDYGTGDDLLTRYGIRRVPLPSLPSNRLRNNPAFAIAEPASSHPLVHDVSRVVTNHATGVEQPSLSPLLVVRGEGEPDVLVGVAGSVTQGRLAAVGDASIVMNAMLHYPGNRAFSLALVRYATEDDAWGTRGGKLYILVNDFGTAGSFGESAGSSRVTSIAREARGQAVAALARLRREGAPPLALYFIALGLALGVVVWTSAHAGRSQRSRPPRFVRATRIVAQGGVAGHAAVLGAPRTSRVLALLELKSALEEELATALGRDRTPPHDQLVAEVRAAGLLNAEGTLALSALLARLSRIELLLVQRKKASQRISDAEISSVAAQVRDLLDAAMSGPRQSGRMVE